MFLGSLNEDQRHQVNIILNCKETIFIHDIDDSILKLNTAS